MGARTLEAGLTLRLLAWLAPLLLALGASALLVTRYALVELDARSASHRAAAALRLLQEESAEGDEAPDETIAEVVTAADTDGARVLVRSTAPRLERRGALPMLAQFEALEDSTCAAANDAQGAPWIGCARHSGPFSVVVAEPTSDTRTALRGLSVAIVGVTIAALVGALITIRRAVRRSTREVAALAAWSRTIAAARSPSPPPGGEAREVTELAATFADVVHRLFDALERERAQSAHIAHELRTPLTSIRAELEALTAAAPEPATRALRDVDHLAAVIDAILVLSAPRERGAERVTVNVADIVRARAPSGARVEAPDEALVWGDPGLLDLAVKNLVDNAEKHAGGAFALRVSRDGRGLRVTVSDRGPGVDDEARSRMFDRYWQANERGDGVGLGLALVRTVAERHGGTAEAAPSEEGRGLDVSFVLPEVIEWSTG